MALMAADTFRRELALSHLHQDGATISGAIGALEGQQKLKIAAMTFLA
jgi:hypothetical protein